MLFLYCSDFPNIVLLPADCVPYLPYLLPLMVNLLMTGSPTSLPATQQLLYVLFNRNFCARFLHYALLLTWAYLLPFHLPFP